jgi:cytochrome P450
MDTAVQNMMDALKSGQMYENPFPIWNDLRELAPLVHLPLMGGMWLSTRWANTSALARDPRLSSARGGRLSQALPPEHRDIMTPVVDFVSSTVVLLDPPRHTRIRKLMMRAFAPEVFDRLRPRMEAMFDRMLDEWIDSGETDIMATLLHPFPALVIADLLGFPREDWSQFMKWANALIRIIGVVGVTPDEARYCVPLVEEMLAYVREAVDDRSRHRRDDVLSLLLEMEDGDVLDREEVVKNAALLLFAGHETTRNLVGSGLHLLLSSENTDRRIPSDPVALRLAIDELLRLTSPAQILSRIVTEDFESDGQLLQKGETLLLGWAAANRDPRQFEDPERIMLDRRYNPHLAFGAGPHACLGLHLARTEAQIVFERLWRRLPDLRLEPGGTTWQPSLLVHGPSRLQVTAPAVSRCVAC